MRFFSTSIVFFVLVVSAYGFELLRSGLRFQDGRTVIYRFEVPDRAVSPTVGREKASQTALDWASTFYRAPDLDLLDVGSRNTPINFWLVSMVRGSDRQTVYAVILGDGSIVEPVEDHTTPYEDLMTLAHRKFTEFASDVERETFEKLFQDIHNGQRADFTPELSAIMSPQEVKSLTDPVNAGRWGKERVIRAEWLNWLCTNQEASALVKARGIEIAGARIDGVVDLSWARIQFPLRAVQCAFTETIILDGSSLRTLQLQGSNVHGLRGEGLSVEKDIVFEGFHANGPVILLNAKIGGSLRSKRGSFDRGQAVAEDGILPPALSLTDAQIGAGLYLQDSESRGAIVLNGAAIDGDLDCEGAQFDGSAGHKLQDNALFAEAVRVSGNAHLCRYVANSNDYKDFDANGTVVLRNATIAGNLDCYGGKFSAPETAIDAESIKIGANVYLRQNFQCKGALNLRSATIGGNLDCDNGQFLNPSHMAINAESIKVGADVYMRGYFKSKNRFQSKGWVSFRNAIIAGNFDCDGGLFDNGHDDALGVNSAKIDGSVLLRYHFEAHGTLRFLAATIGSVLEIGTVGDDGSASLADAMLDLRDVRAEGLLNETRSWPRECNLHGFIFNILDDRTISTSRSQILWLSLQPRDHFIAQPYDQMATVLRNMGLAEEGVRVLIAKNDVRAQHTKGFKELVWYHIFGPSIGYGYQPLKALLASVVAIGIGFLLFHSGYKRGIIIPAKYSAFDKDGQLLASYPKFNAFIYSLEAFVPLLKLGLEDYWIPSAHRDGRLSGTPWPPYFLFCLVGLIVWSCANIGTPLLAIYLFSVLLLAPLLFWSGDCCRIAAHFGVDRLLHSTTGSGLRWYLWLHIIAGWILTTLLVAGLTGLLKT